MAGSERIARLGQPDRIWAIPACHAEIGPLRELHEYLAAEFRAGDRIVYLGNMIGHGGATLATVDELIRFRREIIARREVLHTDVVYLRGAQEEIWHRLLQLQFAPNPGEVLQWMLSNGAAPIVRAYGGDPQAGICAARSGAKAITRWTNALRHGIRLNDGHTQFFSVIRRAALTDYSQSNQTNTMLVSAGVCPVTPLENQGETLWFGGKRFDQYSQPVHGCGRVIRGRRNELNAPMEPSIGAVSATLDSGCGPHGGMLNLACIDPSGEVEIARQFQIEQEVIDFRIIA